MSSNRLERKRRSTIDIRDDSADEKPPKKIKRESASSSFRTVLTEKVKSIFSWLTPEPVKNYLINAVRTFSSPTVIELDANTDSENMMDDDDEISIIGGQNGASGVRPRNNIIHIKRDRNVSICPLASTPCSFPMFTQTNVLDRTSRLQRFPVNGFSAKQDADQHRQTNIAPITNPISEIEIFLKDEEIEDEELKENKDIQVVSDSKYKKHSQSPPKKAKLSVDKVCSISKLKRHNFDARSSGMAFHSFAFRSTKLFTTHQVLKQQDRAKYEALVDTVSNRRNHHASAQRRRSDTSVLLHQDKILHQTIPDELSEKNLTLRTSGKSGSMYKPPPTKAEYQKQIDYHYRRHIYTSPKTTDTMPSQARKSEPTVIDLTADDKPILNYHFKQEKMKLVTDFISKHLKPCSLVPYLENNRESPPNVKKEEDEPEIIESTPFIPKLRPTTIVEDEDDVPSSDWIAEFKIRINLDTERTMQSILEQEEKVQRFKKRRDTKLNENKRRHEQHVKDNIIFPGFLSTLEVEKDVLPEITVEMDVIIRNALTAGDPSEQLSTLDRLSLTRNDLATLTNLNWLNDEVINFYMALIAERSKQDNYPSVHVFNSFFYSSLKSRGESNVLRWTRRIDIFAHDIILVPLHLDMHWALLTVDNRSKVITYYDSMMNKEERCLPIMQSYLVCEMKDKKKAYLDPDTYSLEFAKDIPKQMNGSDCGMFTLKYAEYISRDAPITFTQANMPYFRRRMIYELLAKQIL